MYGVSFLKERGKPIEGAGDGTSDSIKKQVPAGSFIMPADSSGALGLSKPGAATPQQGGFGAPGYQGEQVPVNLSNGEFEIPPEQVHALGVQFLNKAKNATHTPVPEKRRGGELFFANGGLVEDEEKPKQNSFDITNTPSAQRQAGITPSMSSPPVSGQLNTGSSLPSSAGVSGMPPEDKRQAPGIGAGIAGGAKAVIAGLALPSAAIVDGVRTGAARITGGDPATLDGGPTKYRDMALGAAAEGVAQSGAAAEALREKGRVALGVQPFMNSSANSADQASEGQLAPVVPGTTLPAADTAKPSRPAPAQGSGFGVSPWMETGIGADRQGGQIVARAGASGTAEFTNATASPEAVSGASPMPAGGFGVGAILNRGQRAPQPGLGVGFAQQGSAQNIGNGVGTFSQATAGDAQLALGRFERANQEREKMIQTSRRGSIGEGGGRVTVVADSTRSPSISELARNRQAERLAQTEALRSQTQQGGQLATQRMATEQLSQQRLQQQIDEGQVAAQDRQRLDDLRAQIANPAISEQQRAEARQAYNSLSTPAKDRYIAQDVVMGVDDNNRPILGRQIIDVSTGQPVSTSQAQGTPRQVTRAEIEQTAREEGMSSTEVESMLRSRGIAIQG